MVPQHDVLIVRVAFSWLIDWPVIIPLKWPHLDRHYSLDWDFCLKLWTVGLLAKVGVGDPATSRKERTRCPNNRARIRRNLKDCRYFCVKPHYNISAIVPESLVCKALGERRTLSFSSLLLPTKRAVTDAAGAFIPPRLWSLFILTRARPSCSGNHAPPTCSFQAPFYPARFGLMCSLAPLLGLEGSIEFSRQIWSAKAYFFRQRSALWLGVPPSHSCFDGLVFTLLFVSSPT
jgi:hypothetical protein